MNHVSGDSQPSESGPVTATAPAATAQPCGNVTGGLLVTLGERLGGISDQLSVVDRLVDGGPEVVPHGQLLVAGV